MSIVLSNSHVSMCGWKPSDQISTYFKFYEVVASDTADRHGILNTLTSTEIRNAQALAEQVLDKVREKFGVTLVNSWYRCEKLEKAIAKSGYQNWLRKYGRKDNQKSWEDYFSRKQHPQGMAADIEVADPEVSNTELFNWIKHNCKFDQLILECVTSKSDPRSGWVHVSFNPFGFNRQQAFEI